MLEWFDWDESGRWVGDSQEARWEMGGSRRPGKGRDWTERMEPSREEGGEEMDDWSARSASRILPPRLAVDSLAIEREEDVGVADDMRRRAKPIEAGEGGQRISRVEGVEEFEYVDEGRPSLSGASSKSDESGGSRLE